MQAMKLCQHRRTDLHSLAVIPQHGSPPSQCSAIAKTRTVEEAMYLMYQSVPPDRQLLYPARRSRPAFKAGLKFVVSSNRADGSRRLPMRPIIVVMDSLAAMTESQLHWLFACHDTAILEGTLVNTEVSPAHEIRKPSLPGRFK